MGKFFLLLHLFLFGFPILGFCGGVDLHTHLFMKEGLGWFFQGDFNGPLAATSWKDRLSSKTNAESLDKSGLDIVVAALYANPIFKLSLRDSIRRQILLARQFVKKHPNWILAVHPNDANEALKQGKQVLILSLEGAAGILETEEDLREFVDQGGIRIVNLLHLTDDEFGGVAFLRSYRILSSPVAFLKSLFHPTRDEDGNRLNDSGLTEAGRKMALSLIHRKVWIDLAHSSDASQKELIPLMIQEGQPLLYTHTVLRKYHTAERAISQTQLSGLAHSHGIIGVVPSEEMLEGTPVQGSCQGGFQALMVQFKEMVQVVGQDSVDLGSDFNGGIPGLRPSCSTGTVLDQQGFWNIGQSQVLWNSMEREMPPTASQANALHFIEVWSKLWSPK